MSQGRTRATGIAAGVVGLLLVVGLGVGLPELTDGGETTEEAVDVATEGPEPAGPDASERNPDVAPEDAPGDAATEADPSADLGELPEQLPGGLVALAGDELPAGLTPEAVEAVPADQAYATRRLQEIYDVASSTRIYTDQAGSRVALITVIDAPPGPFLPDGPPLEVSVRDVERPDVQLLGVGEDTVCSLNFGAPVPLGQPIPQDPPVGLKCQLDAGQRTVVLSGQFIPATEARAAMRGAIGLG